MNLYTRQPSRSSRASNSHNDRRHRADFARAAVFAEFGYRHGRAIDYAEFIDRQPDQAPLSAPGARR